MTVVTEVVIMTSCSKNTLTPWQPTNFQGSFSQFLRCFRHICVTFVVQVSYHLCCIFLSLYFIRVNCSGFSMSATEQDYLPTVLYRIQRKYNPRHYMNFIGFPWLYIQPKYVTNYPRYLYYCTAQTTDSNWVPNSCSNWFSPCFCCLQMSPVAGHSQAPRLEQALGQGKVGHLQPIYLSIHLSGLVIYGQICALNY